RVAGEGDDLPGRERLLVPERAGIVVALREAPEDLGRRSAVGDRDVRAAPLAEEVDRAAVGGDELDRRAAEAVEHDRQRERVARLLGDLDERVRDALLLLERRDARRQLADGRLRLGQRRSSPRIARAA